MAKELIENAVSLKEGRLRATWYGRIPYHEGMELMDTLWKKKAEGLLEDDLVMFLEHEPVITYGRGTPSSDLPPADYPILRVEVNRGGLATYHGPGQLVGYVIVDLKNRAEGKHPDLHEFLRALENGIGRYLSEEWELPSTTVPGRTGVWVQDSRGCRKIVSIGIGVRRWITYHGFALNVCNDLEVFTRFVPCGLRDVEMTSIAKELTDATRLECDLQKIALKIHAYLYEELAGHGWCREVPNG